MAFPPFRTQTNSIILTGPRSMLPAPSGVNEGTAYMCTDSYECFHCAIVTSSGDANSGFLPAGTHYWHGCANTATTAITKP